MKKALYSFLAFLFGFFFLFTSQVSAKVIANQNGDVSVAKSEVVNDDLFVGAKTAEIEGTVNGDVFVGAETVRVSGIINGNLHVGASNLDLSGKVKGNVYVGAGTFVTDKAQIGGSLLVGSGNILLDSATTVGGSLLAGAGNVSVDSVVGRNVFIGAGSVTLNSKVGGEARLGGGNITLGPDAKVAKDLFYATGKNQNEASISDTATIAGMVHKSQYDFANQSQFQAMQTRIPELIRGFGWFSNIVSFLGALVVGFFYLKFYKNHLTKVSDLVFKSFWKSLGVGFLLTIVIVPALLILLLTMVGAALAGVTFMLLVLYLYLAKLVVGFCFGNWLAMKFNWKKLTPFALLAVGLLGLYVLKMIPVIRVFTNLAILWAGLGALTLQLFAKPSK